MNNHNFVITIINVDCHASSSLCVGYWLVVNTLCLDKNWTPAMFSIVLA